MLAQQGLAAGANGVPPRVAGCAATAYAGARTLAAANAPAAGPRSAETAQSALAPLAGAVPEVSSPLVALLSPFGPLAGATAGRVMV